MAEKKSGARARVRFRPVVAGSREVSGARDAVAVSRSDADFIRRQGKGENRRCANLEARDSITLWSASRQLVPGNVQRASWGYKSASVAQASETSIVHQGEAGNDLAQLLRDAVIDVPHAGDSWSDYERVSKARMLSHELRAANVDAVSGVRDLAVGRWFELSGHPEVKARSCVVTPTSQFAAARRC